MTDLIRKSDALYAIAGWDIPSTAIAALPAVTVGVAQIVFDQLNATVGEVELEMVQDAGYAEFTGERFDLHDYVVSIPYDHATAILAALEPVAAPVMAPLSDAEIASIMAEGPKGSPMLMPDPAAIRDAIKQSVGECLAGLSHAEVSREARRKIERAIDAALEGAKP